MHQRKKIVSLAVMVVFYIKIAEASGLEKRNNITI
jgi:hypothetical protein